jgi:hypothetical protein
MFPSKDQRATIYWRLLRVKNCGRLPFPFTRWSNWVRMYDLVVKNNDGEWRLTPEGEKVLAEYEQYSY